MHQDVTLAPVDEEIVVWDEAFEFEIPCEIPSLDVGWDCGSRPAEWIAYRSLPCSCGIIVRLVCNACRVQYQSMMAHHAFIVCVHCKDETKGFDRFEPLKGSS